MEPKRSVDPSPRAKTEQLRIVESTSAKVYRTLRGHSGPVRVGTWDPTGTQVVTADDGGQVLLWDPVKPAQLSQWKAHEGLIVALAWSPDGKEIVTAPEDGTVRILGRTFGARIGELAGPSGRGLRLSVGCRRADDFHRGSSTAPCPFGTNSTGRRQLWACLLDDDGQWLVVHPGGWSDGAPGKLCKSFFFYDSHAGEILPEPEKAQFHGPNLVKKLGISCE